MAVENYQFKPDYAATPGSVLQERLETIRISQNEFAKRYGLTANLIDDIVAGKAGIGPLTAIQFEKVLGVDASIWTAIESNYQFLRAREIEEQYTAANLKESDEI